MSSPVKAANRGPHCPRGTPHGSSANVVIPQQSQWPRWCWYSIAVGHAWDNRFALLNRNEYSQMPFVPFLSSLFSNSSFRRLSRRFSMKVLGARRERRVARTWFLQPLCERLNLLGKRLDLLLEFLDLRFVTGDEGLDKVTSRLGFRWEFEVMLGNAHPSI